MKKVLKTALVFCVIAMCFSLLTVLSIAAEPAGNPSGEEVYTVVFEDWDGTVLATHTYHMGERILSPEDPVRPADQMFTYEFLGWKLYDEDQGPDTPIIPFSQDLGPCEGDALYTAVYIPSYIDYSVTFQYEDGRVISRKYYHYGDTVTVPADPTAPDGYVFTGWTPEVTVCRGNAVYTAVFEPVAPLVEWVSASTTLGGNIGLNFYVKLADQLVNDESTFVRFTFAGRTIDVPFADALVSVKDGVTRYRFTCSLNARNMTDEVTAQVMTSAGAVGDPLKMSIAKYCNYMIQYGGNQELADLMKAMLNYGAAAQVLFDYNTDKLANAELSEEDKVLADVDASAYASVITGSEEGIKISSATLMLQTETSVRIYFMLTGEKTIEDYTFYVDGKEVTPIEKDGKYYVAITDIKAQDLDKTYTITVGGLTIQYSGLSYVNTVIKNPNTAGEKLVNAAKAIFAYNKRAEAYFN